MNAVQTAIFQKLASPSLQANEHDVGQQIRSAIDHIDLSEKGPVQVNIHLGSPYTPQKSTCLYPHGC